MGCVINYHFTLRKSTILIAVLRLSRNLFDKYNYIRKFYHNTGIKQYMGIFTWLIIQKNGRG
jgi:hypothetical protein